MAAACVMNVELEAVYGGSTVCGWASQSTGARLLGAVLLWVFLGIQSVWAGPIPSDGIIIALDSEIQLLDPYAHNHKINAIIDWLVHDQLFFRDPKTLRPIPNLAESLKATDDLTWEIKLRPSIRFHNGEPVDAAAVKFTFDRLLQPDAKFPLRTVFSWVKDVEVVDELTVRLHVHRPVPSLPDVLTRLHVLPPRYFAEVGEEKYGEAPVGAGPYRFVSRKHGGSLTLRANDEYWGGPKSRPSIRMVVFQTILDPGERFRKLLAGEVHIARGLTVEQASLLNHAGVARISAKPTPRVVFLQMDGDGRASKTPLMDRRVRRAINYALPVDDMITTLRQKFAVRVPGGLTPLYFGYDPNMQPRAFDLLKARTLLNEAGYTEAFEIPLNFSPAAVPGAERLSASIMDSLEKVGVKVKIRRFADPSEFYTQFRQGKLEGMTLLSWGNGASFDADAIYYPLFHSGQPHAYNTSPELDKLLDDGRATIDPEKRKAIYSALQKSIVDQAYWVPLYGQYVIEGVNRQLDYEASSDELMHVFLATWNGNRQPD
jgi:peptide/nickel transport system substrate-binding protein